MGVAPPKVHLAIWRFRDLAIEAGANNPSRERQRVGRATQSCAVPGNLVIW